MRATNKAFRVWATVAGVGVAAIAVVGGAAHPALGQGRLIGIDSNRSYHEIDVTTGARTLLGTMPTAASTTGGLAYDCENERVFVSGTLQDKLMLLDLDTGAMTVVGFYDQSNPDILMHGIEWYPPTQTLYGVSSHNGGLYTINTDTGAATLVGTSGISGQVNFAYNSDDGKMYATVTSTTNDAFYSLDITNGAMTFIGFLTGIGNPHGTAYNKDNHKFYVMDTTSDNLFTVNLATGEPTVVGFMGTSNMLGLMYVPETCDTPNPCTADFNNADGVTADDIFAFLDAWFVQNGTCVSDCSADFNGEGGVTADDIFAFLDAWFVQNGTCGL